MPTVTSHDDDPRTVTPDEVVTPLRRPIWDQDAERALLAALLQNPETVDTITDTIDGDDFYDPRHQIIFDAITHTLHHDGILPDPITVLDHLRNTGDLPRVHQLIPDLATTPATPLNAPTYARIIRDHAIRRRLINRGQRFLQTTETATLDQLHTALDDWFEFGDHLTNALTGTRTRLHHTPTIDELLADPDDQPDWLVPDLLERQDRVIITADEGAGKSTLLRQIAVTTAAGIHPFTQDPITPIHVLHVDVENTTRQSRRRYRPLRIQAGDRLDPERLHIEIRTGGLDLTQPDDATWLDSLCNQLRPDLLLIGPIYKLANGDPTEEKSAKPVAMTIDRLRETYDLAVILEAHAAKATGNGNQRKRPHEPYGWSGWMRWPEFGIWLDQDGSISHWRGAREERNWPTHLQRGGTWPWTPALNSSDQIWQDIRTARLRAKRPVSVRELERETGINRNTLQRLIGKNGQFEHLWTPFNQNQHPMDDPR